MPEIAAGNRPIRLLYLDHLRTFLVTLVVVHHVALVYGGVAPFYYVEYPTSDPDAFRMLLVFVLFNQAWFMGALFLLAGYFTPASLERKEPVVFLSDRFIRLGLPLLLFFFVLNPLSSWLGARWASNRPAESGSVELGSYWETVGLGPTWFIALLLIFSVIYVLSARLNICRPTALLFKGKAGCGLAILAFGLLLAVLSYLVRREIPIGRSIAGFPTLAYLPQYGVAFLVGIIAFRNDGFSKITAAQGIAGFLIAFLASVFLFPLATSGQWFVIAVGPTMTNAMGYGLWQSGVYALWDSLVFVGLVLALIPAFRFLGAGDNKLESFFATQSYAVYIFHVPVIVVSAIVLQNLQVSPFLKFIFASAVMVPVCFVVAFLVRKIPKLDRVF